MLYKLLLIAFLPMNLLSFSLNDPQAWIGVTDQVMGGVSDLAISHSEGIFFMKGNVSTDNNGGFVRLSNRIDISSNDFKGIKFKAKFGRIIRPIPIESKRKLGLRIKTIAIIAITTQINGSNFNIFK